MAEQNPVSWWRQKPVWAMLFLGVSAGVPFFLVFSTTSVWLREAGIDRSTITYFSWALLAYSFKFIWAPIVDNLSVPLLTRCLGRRRAWMLLSQLAIVSSILLMSYQDPAVSLIAIIVGCVLLGFSSATQDIVIDAFRIESAPTHMQAMLASTYITGYRTAQIIAVAGSFSLAQYLGSSTESYSYLAWQTTYLCIAAVMLLGIATTLWVSEPSNANVSVVKTADQIKLFLVFIASVAVFVLVIVLSPDAPALFDGFGQTVWQFVFQALVMGLGLLAAFAFARFAVKGGFLDRQLVEKSYQQPISDFLTRYGKLAIWVLLLVGFYRISDIVLGVIAYVFYLDMGFTKAQIGFYTKTFGTLVTIGGTFLGGFLVIRYGVMRMLLFSAIAVSLVNLSFVWLANSPPDVWRLALVILFDNLTQGVSLVVFIAWLSNLTNIEFTATQYAIFSSLMTLFPKLLGGYSGTFVDLYGYSSFFIFASVLGVPVVALIIYLKDKLVIKDERA